MRGQKTTSDESSDVAIHQLGEDQVLPEKGRQLDDGIYVHGAVNGEPVLFTADTGASQTVLSTRVYEGLEPQDRPPLERSECLKGARGVPVKEQGKAKFIFRLGSLEIIEDAVVADIEDDALLGYDVLNGSEKGPADILLSRNKIVLDGEDIPCFQVGVSRTRRVVMADETSNPGRHEALVDVYDERIAGEDEVKPGKDDQGPDEDDLESVEDDRGPDEDDRGPEEDDRGPEKMTEGQMKMTEDQTKMTEDQMKMTEDQRKMTEDQMKMTEDQAKTTADQTKMPGPDEDDSGPDEDAGPDKMTGDEITADQAKMQQTSQKEYLVEPDVAIEVTGKVKWPTDM